MPVVAEAGAAWLVSPTATLHTGLLLMGGATYGGRTDDCGSDRVTAYNMCKAVFLEARSAAIQGAREARREKERRGWVLLYLILRYVCGGRRSATPGSPPGSVFASQRPPPPSARIFPVFSPTAAQQRLKLGEARLQWNTWGCRQGGAQWQTRAILRRSGRTATAAFSHSHKVCTATVALGDDHRLMANCGIIFVAQCG